MSSLRSEDFRPAPPRGEGAAVYRFLVTKGVSVGADWWTEIIAAVAALVAIWQAWEARRARKEARQSAADAADHEQRALQASTESAAAAVRSAAAQERLAEVAESGAERSPWALRKKSAQLWQITNVSDHPLSLVFVFLHDPRLAVDDDDGSDRTVGPGEAIMVRYPYQEGQQKWAAMELSWSNARGAQVEEEFTLQWKAPPRIIH
ncbi:hypothetical protein BIV03_04065 [Curtobacterium sp. MCBA15_016]|nr:hypothetical protein BIV03_04065 [Curtobacterium sp. MCBA15_016]